MIYMRDDGGALLFFFVNVLDIHALLKYIEISNLLLRWRNVFRAQAFGRLVLKRFYVCIVQSRLRSHDAVGYTVYDKHAR